MVKESKRELLVFARQKLLKTYSISLGGNPLGDKKYEGDQHTPGGLYIINDKNAHSDFHKNLGVSYPGAKDMEEAKALGKLPGGDIKIHGIKNVPYDDTGRFFYIC